MRIGEDVDNDDLPAREREVVHAPRPSERTHPAPAARRRVPSARSGHVGERVRDGASTTDLTRRGGLRGREVGT